MSATILISLGGLAIALVSLVISRIVTRKVRVLVHRASFVGLGTEGPDCYFITVTNLSLNREVEITHVWFDTPAMVHVLRNDRPLPKRLKVDEAWSTWMPVIELPVALPDDEVYKLVRVRLSNGKVFRSKQNKGVPVFGSVPGGNPPEAPTGTLMVRKGLPEAENGLTRQDSPAEREGRLELSTIGSSVQVQPGSGFSATLISVKNIEGRFENTCHNVKAELKYVHPHTGDGLKASALFVRTDGQSITAEPKRAVSLEMLQSAHFALLVRNDTTNRGFFTFTNWPFDPQTEKRLPLGEWHLHISVSSDAENDEATLDYIVQLNPDLSSAWSPNRHT